MEYASLTNAFKTDDIIAGRYRIVKVLGAGGMGVVVAARHMDLDSLVAIKLLRPEILSNQDVVARFAAEARAAVRIKSEHVARVTDVGALADGAPYMVMEYLEGQDLEALVEHHGPLPCDIAVDFVLQACEAIAEAHSLGIVHRDLKPGNLFLCRRADGSELVKVLDFGISKATSGSGSNPSLTSTSTMLGSPTHMSPEQITSSKSVDVRADIWSLGVIVHQILSGDLPFRAESLPELFIAIIQQQPVPLQSVRHDVPPGLAAVVLRCLEKDRANRFANIGEFTQALAPYAPQRSAVSVERILRLMPASAESQAKDPPPWTETVQLQGLPGVPGQSGVQANSVQTQGTWGRTTEKTASNKSKKMLIASGAVGIAVAGTAFAYQLVSHPSGIATSPSGVSTAILAAIPSESAPGPAVPTAAARASEPEVVPAPAADAPKLDAASHNEVAVAGSRTEVRAPSNPGLRGAAQRPVQTQAASTPSATPSAAPSVPQTRPSVVPPAQAAKPANGEWEDERR